MENVPAACFAAGAEIGNVGIPDGPDGIGIGIHIFQKRPKAAGQAVQFRRLYPNAYLVTKLEFQRLDTQFFIVGVVDLGVVSMNTALHSVTKENS